VIGKPDPDGRWQLRLWWKPGVTLIWFGGLLIAIGGALSIVGRVRRERRAAAAQPVEDQPGRVQPVQEAYA
jgi:cytochrome c-type biogenesis protein CcmF